MIKTKYNFLCVILILFIFQNISAQVKFKDINLNQAIKLAQKENKKILIYLYSIPCPACTLLTRNIFENSDMGKFINSKYICFKLHGDKTYKKNDPHASLIKKYKIGRGFPVVLLLTSDGKFIDRIRGFSDKESYWQTLKDYTNDIYTYGYYQNNLKTNPHDCESMVALAKKYHDRHMRDKAFQLFESAVKYNSCKKNALTWFILSRYYDHQGKIDKAIFACEMAVGLNPENSQFQSSLTKLKQYNNK
jgi:thioredoxin-related protein